MAESAASDDGRALLRVPPDEYIGERARLIKEARAAKDRDRAALLQGLKKPNLAMWAVLVAGEDADSVRRLLEATAELGEVQGTGAGRNEVAAATRHRRDAVEAMVGRAVAALAAAESKSSAELRRAEIRTLVDQLSRHPEVAEQWVAGTLRDLPEEGFGFGAFAGVDLGEVEAKPRPVAQSKPRKRAGKRAAASTASTASPASTRAEESSPQRRVDLKAEREARRAVAAAERELAIARRRLDEAKEAAQRAQEQFESRQAAHDQAARALEAASAHLDSIRD